MKTHWKRLLRFLFPLSVLALLFAPGVNQACFIRSPQPVQVWLDHIDVKITDQVAVKTYDCTFLNPNPRAVVGGICYMELEPGARISNMSVVVNGKKSEAEILDVKKANKVFTQIVKEGGSPALLEYFGNQLIQTRVPKIPPRGTVTVKLQYTMVLEKKGDLVRLQMLNTNPKSDMKALKAASVKVSIRSQEPIKNIYSPTHAIKLTEDPDWDVVIDWSEKNYLPKNPFVLYYQISEQAVGASVLAHSELGEGGHFMLMLSPTMGKGKGALAEKDILPKDVVFCVDTSGSMLQGNKMEQARKALEYCLGNLRAKDRFNIVDFGTGVRTFARDGLVSADKDNRDRALAYVNKLSARGGTAMDEALGTSLNMLEESDRLKMILFATDGLPTIGERTPDTILGNMAKRNKKDVRMFVFGEGFDVNTKLLDLLALNHRGESEYILPDEDITKKISGFFDRVGSPVMTDLKVEIEGLDIKDVFPKKIPDIYRGEQVVVYGRYDGSGKKTVKVSGNFEGTTKTVEYSLEFPEVSEDERNAFVPRLWAGQMVDYLLNEIRQRGEDKELIQEVTYLAKRYGIVTPYTSFLMVAENCNQPMAKQVAGFQSRLRVEGNLLGQAFGKTAVTNAWQQSRNRRNLAKNGAVAGYYTQVADALKQEGRAGTQAMAAVRYVNNRTFYNSGNVWYDSRFDVSKQGKVQNVTIGSTEYVKLLNDNPKLSKYMSQGEVVVELKGQWYQFSRHRS